MTTKEQTDDAQNAGDDEEGRRSARATAPKVKVVESEEAEESDKDATTEGKKVVRPGDDAKTQTREDADEQRAEQTQGDDASAAGDKSADAGQAEVPEDLAAAGSEWLEGLFERMKLDVEVGEITEASQIHFNLGGSDANRLLGLGNLAPKAIEGVETLLGTVFSRHPDSSDIYVDVDKAREQRKAKLQRIANDLADKAVNLGKTVTVSGFNSTERRVIHRELRNYGDVDTESIGNGVFRRLQIEPK